MRQLLQPSPGWWRAGHKSSRSRFDEPFAGRDVEQPKEEEEEEQQPLAGPPLGPKPGGHQIVVFVDDLDRCSSSSAMVEVLEAINIVLGGSRFFVVLGMDKAIIRAAIVKDADGVDSDKKAEEFLQKIVQVGLMHALGCQPWSIAYGYCFGGAAHSARQVWARHKRYGQGHTHSHSAAFLVESHCHLLLCCRHRCP